METTFTYERLRTPIGVKAEHISGGEQYGRGPGASWPGRYMPRTAPSPTA